MRQAEFITGLFVIGALALEPSWSASQVKPISPKPVTATLPIADFRLVPVRVHLMRSPDAPAANTTLTEKDINRIFKKVNGIWHAAGVHLWAESIVEEKPASVSGHEGDKELPDDALLALRPADSRPSYMFHVYYIGAMRANGMYVRKDAIFVKESARLRKVVGGIDEPLPRVTAHELGHGMGLLHRQDVFNLMASGTTGTSLSDAEIEIVRHTVYGFNWALTPEEFLKKADEAAGRKNKAEAISRYTAMIDLPGESLLKDQSQCRLKVLQAR